MLSIDVIVIQWMQEGILRSRDSRQALTNSTDFDLLQILNAPKWASNCLYFFNS